MEKKSEMEKLIDMLTEARVPYEICIAFSTPQVCYPNQENCICDAICHKYSYGFEQGLLEIMGLVDEEEVGDNVEGYLKAEEVFNRILCHYINNMGMVNTLAQI